MWGGEREGKRSGRRGKAGEEERGKREAEERGYMVHCGSVRGLRREEWVRERVKQGEEEVRECEVGRGGERERESERMRQGEEWVRERVRQGGGERE